MKEINLPPFYVGQRVVAIKDHSMGSFKKGDIKTVLGIEKLCCCWNIDVGIKFSQILWQCNTCKALKDTNQIGWINARSFAPIQENFQSISLEKILEKETELISSN